MITIHLFSRQPWIADLGWTLVHFLWQGTLISVLLAVVRALMGRSLGTRGRYLLACVALSSMVIAPVLTFLVLETSVLENSSVVSPALWRASLSANVWQQILPWLVAVWIAGVTVFSVRLIGGWHLTRRLRTVAIGPIPQEWQETFDQLIRRMRVSAPVRLLTSSLVTVPTVVGWIRPVVLMPVTALTGLPLDQVKALLAHELAHICRQDYVVNIVQSIAEALLFYHPAVWWVSDQIRAEREACCDDLAVEASGDVLVYVQALVDLESQRRASLNAAFKTALAADGGSLVNRIRRLIQPPQPASHTLQGLGAAWVVGFLWLAGIGAATLHGAPSSAARMFTPPRLNPAATTFPMVTLEAPPVIKLNPPRMPALGALLFDPFIPPPQAAAPGATITGKVIADHSGAPVASAEVHFYRTGTVGLAADLETDVDGKFSASELDPGEYRLEISKPNHLGATVRLVVTGTESSPPNVLARLIRSGAILGQVKDAQGKPIVGAHVMAMARPKAGAPLQPDFATGRIATVDARGQYRLYNLPPGEYAVVASYGASTMAVGSTGSSTTSSALGSGFQFFPENTNPRFFSIAGGDEIRNIDFNIRTTAMFSVNGQVQLPDPKARFWLALSTLDQPALAAAVAQSAADGKFTFPGISPGSYNLLAFKTGGARNGRGAIPDPDVLFARMRVIVTTENIEGISVVPENGRSVNLILHTSGGCPATAQVTLAPLEDWSAQLERHVTITTAKEQTETSLAPSRYAVSAVNSGACSVPSSIVDLTGSGNPGLVTVELAPSGSIRGRLDAGGRRVTDFAAVLLAANFDDPANAVHIAMPEADGKFAFSGLPPGRYRIAAKPVSEASPSHWLSEAATMLEFEVGGGANLEINLAAPPAVRSQE